MKDAAIMSVGIGSFLVGGMCDLYAIHVGIPHPFLWPTTIGGIVVLACYMKTMWDVLK